MTEVFKFAGTDLRSAGLYMSVVDGILTAPPIRGANLVIPYQPGQRWTQKYYDQRHIVLAGDLHSLTSRQDFQAKADLLKTLFMIGAGEQPLEVQWADGTSRYIMAEVINTLGLQWTLYPTRSSAFSIELIASDPFWYGSKFEDTDDRLGWMFDAGISFDDGAHWFDSRSVPYFAQQLVLTPTNVEATNSGNYVVRKPIFTLSGLLINPKIRNLRNGYSIQLSLSTFTSDSVVIDCGAQTVTKNGIPQSLSAVNLGAGQTDWMHLEPGENTLRIDFNSGGPVSYSAQYSPVYL